MIRLDVSRPVAPRLDFSSFNSGVVAEPLAGGDAAPEDDAAEDFPSTVPLLPPMPVASVVSVAPNDTLRMCNKHKSLFTNANNIRSAGTGRYEHENVKTTDKNVLKTSWQ